MMAQVAGNPDPSQLPGGQVLQQLTNGIMGWALILSLVALVVSAVTWALGANSNNYQSSVAGRRGVVVAGLAALTARVASTSSVMDVSGPRDHRRTVLAAGPVLPAHSAGLARQGPLRAGST